MPSMLATLDFQGFYFCFLCNALKHLFSRSQFNYLKEYIYVGRIKLLVKQANRFTQFSLILEFSFTEDLRLFPQRF